MNLKETQMYWVQERPGFRVSSLLRRTDNGGAVKYDDSEVFRVEKV